MEIKYEILNKEVLDALSGNSLRVPNGSVEAGNRSLAQERERTDLSVVPSRRERSGSWAEPLYYN